MGWPGGSFASKGGSDSKLKVERWSLSQIMKWEREGDGLALRTLAVLAEDTDAVPVPE